MVPGASTRKKKPTLLAPDQMQVLTTAGRQCRQAYDLKR